MTSILRTWSLAILMGILTVGCQRESPPSQAKEKQDPAKAAFLLASEPAGAKGVIDLRKETHADRDLVVVGRVGGSKKPFIAGRASFTIVDPSLKTCSEREGDDCETPWDYCCETPDDLAKATILIKFVDDQGKTMARDAKSDLGLKEMQTVVVQGKARYDAEGNLTAILAKGVFVRPDKGK